jgi:hypothetical protein
MYAGNLLPVCVTTTRNDVLPGEGFVSQEKWTFPVGKPMTRGRRWWQIYFLIKQRMRQHNVGFI